MKIFLELLLVLSLVVLLVGCSPDITSKDLEGTWKVVEETVNNKVVDSNREILLKFSSDDTLSMIVDNHVLSQSKYELIDGEKIKTFPEGKEPVINECTLKGEQLIITGDGPNGGDKNLTYILEKQ